MHYAELSILLDPAPGGGSTARVVRSPDGGTTGAVPLDLDLAGALLELAASFECQARADGGAMATAPADGEAELLALGKRLSAALFSPPIRDRFVAALGAAPKGLRIRLQTSLEPAAAGGLSSLPWEALARPDDAESPLSLDRHTALVRAIDLPIGCRPLPFEGPLRILVVAAAPRDQVRLDLTTEIQMLQDAFIPRQAAVTVLPRADLSKLRSALLDGDFHVLHFMGHGEIDRATGRGLLLFEDQDGRSLRVDGEDLAAHLRGVPSLRLAFLNACRTAGAAAGAPFATVAAALLRAGIPAVLAMQLPVSDRAAVAFSEETYRRLAAGDPLEAAVTEGRLAIHRACPGSGEWVTPVLFLRSADGRILEPRRGKRRLLAVLAGALLLAVLAGSLARWLASRTLPAQAASPRTSPAAQPEIHTLQDGKSILVAGWQARLGVEFRDKSFYPGFGDQRVVTVALTPKGGETQLKTVLAAPKDLDFLVGGKTLRVTVEHIDERARTVRVSLYSGE